jgi:hypothetical protein
MTQPQPDPLNTTEAKANPRVEAAFRSVANATVQLHLAVAAFGIGRPGESVMPLVPALLDEALQEGLSRVTVRQAPATSWPALLARVRELEVENQRLSADRMAVRSAIALDLMELHDDPATPERNRAGLRAAARRIPVAEDGGY